MHVILVGPFEPLRAVGFQYQMRSNTLVCRAVPSSLAPVLSVTRLPAMIMKHLGWILCMPSIRSRDHFVAGFLHSIFGLR